MGWREFFLEAHSAPQTHAPKHSRRRRFVLRLRRWAYPAGRYFETVVVISLALPTHQGSQVAVPDYSSSSPAKASNKAVAALTLCA